jgi:hypothetical protein
MRWGNALLLNGLLFVGKHKSEIVEDGCYNQGVWWLIGEDGVLRRDNKGEREMKRLFVSINICLVLCGVGKSAPILLSWSESASEDSLFIEEDQVVFCHILLDALPIDLVGFEFEFFFSAGIEVVEFIPTLDSTISSITPIEQIQPLTLCNIYINYDECPPVSGITCVGSLKLSLSFSEIEISGGSAGLSILAINYLPYFLANVYPDDCGMLSTYIEAEAWNSIGVFCKTSPIAKTTWGNVKALFR